MSSPKIDKYADIAEDFRAALALRDAGNLVAATAQLEELVKHRPEAAFLHGALGGIHLDLGHIDAAIQSFRRATQLSTKSELASLGLFHALYKSGRRREAFHEMRRFIDAKASDEYAQLERELRKELGDTEYERLAGGGPSDFSPS